VEIGELAYNLIIRTHKTHNSFILKELLGSTAVLRGQGLGGESGAQCSSSFKLNMNQRRLILCGAVIGPAVLFLPDC
jgi:hypothetical protein